MVERAIRARFRNPGPKNVPGGQFPPTPFRSTRYANIILGFDLRQLASLATLQSSDSRFPNRLRKPMTDPDPKRIHSPKPTLLNGGAKREVVGMGIFSALLQNQIRHTTESKLGFRSDPISCFARQIQPESGRNAARQIKDTGTHI